MPSRRLTAIVAGLVILLALIARVVGVGSGGVSDIAVDTTGASAKRPVGTAATARVANATVAAPVLAISPLTVSRGASIGVWGSGFPSGATVNIYFKQEVSDNVNPVTVVEADNNGQFGDVSVTVPDSVPSGSLIIQAKEYQGSLTAMATATVVDGGNGPQAVTQTTAATKVTPTVAPAATPTVAAAASPTVAAVASPTVAAAASPTVAAAASPTVAAAASPTVMQTLAALPQPTPSSEVTDEPQQTPQPQPPANPNPTQQPTPQQLASQPKPTEQPQPTANPNPTQQPRQTPQPQATPQSKPTQQPSPTPQPQATPQSKPTQQPQPTSQPQPTPQSKPTQQPKPTPQPQPTPQSKPTQQPRPTPQPQPKPVVHHTSLDSSSYTVQAGDSLSAIAEQVYGDANEWRSLYEANREAIGSNPDLIHPGTELIVPQTD